MTTTDTPRTAAMYETHTSEYQRRLLSEDLERKLAAEIANRKKCCLDGNAISDELFDTQLKLKASKAEVERLRDALKSCFWATNTYDGNYTRACDNVATIATQALKTQDNK